MSEFSMDEFEAIAIAAARMKPTPPALASATAHAPTAAELEVARTHAAARRRELLRRELELERQAWINEYARSSGVPKTFLHKTFADFAQDTEQQREAVDACRDFIGNWWGAMKAGDHSSLWFLGPRGTGKTRLASALVTVLHLEDGVSARLVKPHALIRRLRDTWGRGAGKEREADVLQEFADVEVLVLDDIGADTFGTHAERVQLFEVIDRRYEEGRPTLLTSNEDSQGLLDALGARSYDRLRHGVRVVPLTGESHRRPAA